MKLYFIDDNNTEYHESMVLYDYFFNLERNKWDYVSDLKSAKIIPCSQHKFITSGMSLFDSISPDQIVLLWHVETCDNGLTPEYYRKLLTWHPFYKKHKKILLVHTNALDTNDPQFIHHAIMFNRQKLFCTDYKDELCTQKIWTYTAPRITYKLYPIDKKEYSTNKLFLCPLRVKNQKSDIILENTYDSIKGSLRYFLQQINANLYISDPINNIYLEPNGWSINPSTKIISTKHGGTWYPVADKYYQTSYVSLGVETVWGSKDIFFPCEKSFDPLIKGNFPLIFSAPYTVRRLKEFYDFKFPDWIDYSYDEVENVHLRFAKYTKAIKKLSMMPMSEIHKLYERDKYILEHNRNVFFKTPYDSLYDKVERSIEQLGW